MDFPSVLAALPAQETLQSQPRPYFNHSVELKKVFTARERAEVLEKAGLNVFFFPSSMVTGCDLLSDSGVTTMTSEQWAALHLGDEAYGSNRGYFMLMESIQKTFGDAFFSRPGTAKPNAFIFHQGRACEDALFSLLSREGTGLVIPSNGHFDTTQANIELNHLQALNLFSPELKKSTSRSHFKGNMDVCRLEGLFRTSHASIPLVYLTVTNNTGGGQPVSMQNIAEVAAVCEKYDTPLFFDACRFAENAWFIRKYEKKFEKKSIPAIIHEMFSYVDGFTISFKKDGLVNMGGGLFIKDSGRFMTRYAALPDALLDYQIVKEGHPTYGGMSGRDIMALAVGLQLVTSQEYLSYRIRQVQAFGTRLHDMGIPVLLPVGGHAVYLDVNAFFEGTAMKPDDFGGISLTAVLLAAYGHRACELGYFAFGSYDTARKTHVFPEVNFVRFAVPRLRYEDQDLMNTAEAVKVLYEHREQIPGVDVVYGKELPLRHFKARFAFKK
jgi:tryptophanase